MSDFFGFIFVCVMLYFMAKGGIWVFNGIKYNIENYDVVCSEYKRLISVDPVSTNNKTEYKLTYDDGSYKIIRTTAITSLDVEINKGECLSYKSVRKQNNEQH